MATVSIIIPTFNGVHWLKPCIDAIRTFTTPSYEIIVVDNGSDDGTCEYCRLEKLLFISLSKNLGFPIACNLGMKLACGDHLLLLNNDVIVTHHWLDNLVLALNSQPDIGIVGPVTNYASGDQQIVFEYDNMAHLHQLSSEANQLNTDKWKAVNRLVGLCFLFKREVMDQIGLLDEQFSPGHYEDDDFCFRARRAGFKLLMCGDTFVHHHGSASFSLESSAFVKGLIQRNHRLFIDKWQVDPHQFIEQC